MFKRHITYFEGALCHSVTVPVCFVDSHGSSKQISDRFMLKECFFPLDYHPRPDTVYQRHTHVHVQSILIVFHV